MKKISPRKVADVLMERRRCQGEIVVDAGRVRKCRCYAVEESKGLFDGKWLCQAHLDWEKELEMESRLEGEAEARAS